jgi:hypothetical protein
MARPGLRKHPKFLLLCRMLGEPASHVLGHLEFLWETAYESGKPEIGTMRQVELAADWEGEDGVLVNALLNCGDGEPGFIEQMECDPTRYQIHDLFDHAPDYVRRRMEREAERQANGKTISDLRKEAGSKGAKARWKTAEKNGKTVLPSFAIDGKPVLPSENSIANTSCNTNSINELMAKDGKCLSLGYQHMANGATPAPAPAPALNTNTRLSTDVCSKPDVPASERLTKTNEGDESIYQAYPRHAAKKSALKAILKARKAVHTRGEPHPGQWLLERVKAYAEARRVVCAADGAQDQYTPLPATWFNGGRYDDDPAEWGKTYGKGRTESSQERKNRELDEFFAKQDAEAEEESKNEQDRIRQPI